MSATDRAKKKAEAASVLAECYDPRFDDGLSVRQLMHEQERSLAMLGTSRARQIENDRREAKKQGLALDEFMRKTLRARFSRLDQRQRLEEADGTLLQKLISLRHSTGTDERNSLGHDGVRIEATSLERVGKTDVRRLPDGSELESVSDGTEVRWSTSAHEVEELLEHEASARKPYQYSSGMKKRVIYALVDEAGVKVLTE